VINITELLLDYFGASALRLRLIRKANALKSLDFLQQKIQ
jgi:hypothetical protein